MKTIFKDEQETTFNMLLNDLSKLENAYQIVAFINKTYALNANLLDSFSHIGGIYRENKDWLAAEKWMRRDFEQGRMSPDWQLRYAETLLQISKESQALEMVKKVYTDNPELTDGYARLGWAMARSMRWDECESLMETDYKCKRLSFKWYLHYAYTEMQLGEYELSAVLINQAYSENNARNETILNKEIVVMLT